MAWIQRTGGFVIGFVLTLLLTLALGTLYRGAWLPLLQLGSVWVCFSAHPHFRGEGWERFVGGFAGIGLAVWMTSVERSPTRLDAVAAAAPWIFGLLGLWLLWADSVTERFLVTRPWAAVGFCIAGWAVLYFSSAQGGAGSMVDFVIQQFGWTQEKAERAVLIFRKSVHFTAYGTIGALGFMIGRPKLDARIAAIFGFAIALCFATFDEARQSMAVGRTASVWDIGLDLLGACVFVGLGVLRYQKLNPKSAPGRSEN